MLFMAYKFAEQFTPVAGVNAEACEASGKQICDCLQLKVLKPLIDRQTLVEHEFGVYAEHICNIKSCLENGKRPMYNFQQIVKEQQKRQDSLWNRLLPDSVDRLITLFTDSCNEMTAAYTLTVNDILKKHFRRSSPSSEFPALKMRLDLNWRLENFKDFIAENHVQEIQILVLQHELLKLEVQVLEACIDDVAWVLTGCDEDAEDCLECMMVKRLIQPTENSGTAIREAFVFQGHSHRPPAEIIKMLEEDYYDMMGDEDFDDMTDTDD
ncbi:hypothetical protein BU25DRAFT_447147 [Macroventuria anomochaeta]|uniref:Uncharacterized protein n=1 Tax=Macroventuria anomochaeta TaxID=301207 RepID=A0ACB6S882_9PLEO|nr:uncharacterized protein BU25DRAFT_447147 [Macroventuria anomochaeta]KAF2629727.1 hypothetical protein BU25DRAFT_447147 [Macroventuria anomochaeta]